MKSTDASRAVASRLRAAGIPDASLEAELLTRAAGGLDRTQFFLGVDLDPRQIVRLDQFQSRRLRREPAAYITGRREFYGLPFRVSPHVLVPRPETELLVEVTLNAINSARKPNTLHVVDVGTGSGCVAVAVAKTTARDIAVTAVDASIDALRVARCNADLNEAAVRFVHGDLGGSISTADIVLANLPYIPAGEILTLQPEVSQWEPRRALDGGIDGLDLMRRLIDDCGRRLRPALLALEVGFGQASAVASLTHSAGAQATIHHDLAGIPRVVCARWK